MAQAQTTVYISPYLRNVETGDFVFFERQMAKNPKMVPHWDMPEELMGMMSPADAKKAHARAILNISKMQMTEGMLTDINDVRVKQAKNLGFEADPVLIGADPNVRVSRRGFGRTAADGNTLTIRGIPLEGSGLNPSEMPADMHVISESESSGSVAVRQRRLRAASEALAQT
jgi:hypothetical protein